MFWLFSEASLIQKLKFQVSFIPSSYPIICRAIFQLFFPYWFELPHFLNESIQSGLKVRSKSLRVDSNKRLPL